MPEPACNVRVAGYEVDFLWRAQGLVVEVDGYAFHSSPVAVVRDRLRDVEIEDADYRVRRVTWRQLTKDPSGVERRLRRALAA
jgi:very-short-patch-repair endonuclease